MAPGVKKENEMSSFELKRLQNMAVNKAILKGIETTSAKVLPAKPPTVRKPATSRLRSRRSNGADAPKPPPAPPARITRQSARLAGLDADSEVLKRKREVEEVAQADRARQKRMRVSGDLSLGDIMVEGRKYESSMAGIKGLGVRGAQPGVRTFVDDDVNGTTDETVKKLKQRMGKLALYEKWAVQDIKITPQRIYTTGFHPTEDKPVIFAGDKEGALGVFDASQPGPEAGSEDGDDELAQEPIISAFKTHSRTISSLVFSPSDPNAVYSSSYDSSIRKLDLERGKSVQIYAPHDPSDDVPISHIDMTGVAGAGDPNLLYFTTLHGTLGRVDLRSPDVPHFWSLSDYKIGGFSLHPLHPHLVATASLDRTLKIWDLRKFVGSGKSDARPFLLGRHESRLSVSHAAWSRGGQIATSSYDDTIKIYDVSSRAAAWDAGHATSQSDAEEEEQEIVPTHVVRHNNQTGRWVTILKPQWQARPPDRVQKFAIGNMNRFVDIFAADGTQLAQLGGDGITAVPAVAHFHPTKEWVAGGSASGKLALWM